MMLRLRRGRGMRHTGTMTATLTGYVAHRSKQGKRTARFSPSERFLSDLKGTPPDPRSETMKKRDDYYKRKKTERQETDDNDPIGSIAENKNPTACKEMWAQCYELSYSERHGL